MVLLSLLGRHAFSHGLDQLSNSLWQCFVSDLRSCTNYPRYRYETTDTSRGVKPTSNRPSCYYTLSTTPSDKCTTSSSQSYLARSNESVSEGLLVVKRMRSLNYPSKVRPELR